MKGVTERGLRKDKRERGRGERGRKGQGQGHSNNQFRITTPNYLPMESTTPTPKKYFSFNTMYSFYPHPTKINSVFDRSLGGNCQVFRGVGS